MTDIDGSMTGTPSPADPASLGPTNLFALLHRSLFDPGVYRECLRQSVWQMAAYALFLMAMTATISTVAHVYYFCDPSSGFSARMARVLRDVRFEQGKLVPGRPTPYLPEKSAVQDLMLLMGGSAAASKALPDSFIVIDTGATLNPAGRSGVALVLTSERLVVHYVGGLKVAVPYRLVLGRRANVVVSPGAVQRLVEKTVPLVVANFAFQDMVMVAISLVLGIAFLALAACILIPRGSLCLRGAAVAACLAVTPVAVGMSIEAASGAHVSGTWYLYMMASSIVLVRGVRAMYPASQVPAPRT